MKKSFLAVAFIAFLASCGGVNEETPTTDTTNVAVDTTKAVVDTTASSKVSDSTKVDTTKVKK